MGNLFSCSSVLPVLSKSRKSVLLFLTYFQIKKTCSPNQENLFSMLEFYYSAIDSLSKYLRIMPEAFRKLNCKLCKIGFERTNQILKVILPIFMRIQRFHCKLCETKFAKGHWMKRHVISVHVETKNYIWIMWNCFCNILLDESSWGGKELYWKLFETTFARTHYQMKMHVTLAHDRRNTNPVCKGLKFRPI